MTKKYSASHSVKWSIAAVLLIFIQISIANAQINFAQIDSLLKANTTLHNFSGTVLISQNDSVVFNKSYGLADYKTGRHFTKKTKFQIASVSKQFTAFGIMLLNAKGLLKYEDKVQLHIPQFPYENITVRQLLYHTSGLPEFWEKIRPRLDHSIANGNKELLQYLVVHKPSLEFEPGSKMMYADIGYDLLAMIIENKSGLSYDKFMAKYVFKPAGMKNTKALMVTDIRKIKDKNLAFGHTWNDSLKAFTYTHLLPDKDFIFYLGKFYGDGSVITTAKDLLKWNKVLQENLLLTEVEQRQAYLPARDNRDSIIIANTSSPLKPTYGFGWALAVHPTLGHMFYHSGGHPGFTSYYLRCPDKKLVVIFLCNLDASSAINNVRVKLMEIIYSAF